MQQQIFFTPIRLIILHVMILIFTSKSSFFAKSQKPTSTQSILNLDDGEMRESCPANVCFHGGMCFTKTMPDGTKEFECECLEGFTGDLCELKCTLPCQNGGQCIQMGTNASFCICPTGFTGIYCEKVDTELAIPSEETLNSIEECSVKGRKCLNGGRCIRRENGETSCICKGQFTGIWCDRLLRLTVGNNNNNSEDNDERQWTTLTSNSSNNSDTKVEETTPETTSIRRSNETISPTPKNEETTSTISPKKVETTFFNKETTFPKDEETTTLKGTSPSNNETSSTGGKEEAFPKNEETTSTIYGKDKKTTSQKNEETKTTSAIISTTSSSASTCSYNPCQNGGVCFPLANNRPHCHCPFGRSTGEFCQFQCHCPRGQGCAESTVELGKVECFQRDESIEQWSENVTTNVPDRKHEEEIVISNNNNICVTTKPCLNGANCLPLVGGDFKCQCIPGFSGKRCETDIDECELSKSDREEPACLHGGRCIAKMNRFECNCQGTGYKGSRCELDIDECAEAALNCQNGICINLPGDYRCECKSGYIGQHCHIQDPCVPNPLANHSSHNCGHGKCVRPRVVMGATGREYATHDCDCLPGYTDELCMRLVEAQHAMTLNNFVGIGIVVLTCCISLGILLYLFVGCARRKHANRGTYSPSNQEMTNQARYVGSNNTHRPAIIHPKQGNAPNHHVVPMEHHKPRRKQ